MGFDFQESPDSCSKLMCCFATHIQRASAGQIREAHGHGHR